MIGGDESGAQARPSERPSPTAAISGPRGLVVAVVVLLGLVLNGCGGAGEGESGAAQATEPASAPSTAPPTTASPTVEAPITAPPTTAPPTTAPPTTEAPIVPGRPGVFVPVPGDSAVTGSGALLTYSVEVEEAVGLDPTEVGATVDAALADPRSWTADGSTSVQRVGSGGQIRIVLATPPTVDELCAPLRTNGIFSCRRGDQLNINSDRWRNGTDDWPLGIEAYRAHVINHEMGHALGHGHESCPGPGETAPVMMQQTKGLLGCEANPWPFPEQASSG